MHEKMFFRVETAHAKKDFSGQMMRGLPANQLA